MTDTDWKAHSRKWETRAKQHNRRADDWKLQAREARNQADTWRILYQDLLEKVANKLDVQHDTNTNLTNRKGTP